MAGQICPFLSAQAEKACLQDSCMMFTANDRGGQCNLAKGGDKVANRLDILSAQVQEMQVALLEIEREAKK